ncbi:PhiH1 repressor [Halostella salina]|uniref:PhiH1 repressor n=1 Tax=Halostella salina TaxID=1547897 RepID=UPI000EF76958
MRHSGTWMTVWDDRILEYIRETEGESASVGELANSDIIHVSNSHVSRRCRKLAEKGLLLPLGNGVYGMTDEGEAYLDGEYNAEEEAYINGNGENNGPTASETGDI